MLLARAGFEPVPDLSKALMRTREALDATRGDERDHRVRLDAAERVFRLADVLEPRKDESSDPTRPVNVTVVLTGADARTALPACGVRVHLDGDRNGEPG